MLGRKLLRGEIPVVPPSQLHRCPVPSTHENHDEICKDYEEGRIGYDEALEKVGESLRKKLDEASEPKPKPEQPRETD